ISADGSRLHVTDLGGTSPTRPPSHFVLDPVSLATTLIENLGLGSGTPVEVKRTHEVLVFGADVDGTAKLFRVGAGRPAVVLPGPPVHRRVVVPPGDARAFVALTDAVSGMLAAVDLATNAFTDPIRVDPNPEPVELISSPPGVPTCLYGLDSRFVSFPS